MQIEHTAEPDASIPEENSKETDKENTSSEPMEEAGMISS